MKLTLVCSKCEKKVVTAGKSGSAAARKLKWGNPATAVFICPDCGGKPVGKPRINATHVKADGHSFDSQMELRYYGRLKKRLTMGEISMIAVHPSFPLYEAYTDDWGRHWPEIKVTFDFQYIDLTSDICYVDDCKPTTSAGKAISNDRAKAFLPIIQRIHPAVQFRFVDEWGKELVAGRRSSGAVRAKTKGNNKKVRAENQSELPL